MNDSINITRAFLPSKEEFLKEIDDIWESRWLTNMGDKHARLEKELRDYLGVREISLMTNGHLALELCLQALSLTGEVITTPFTFASTTHAIVRNGLEPVFCDIDPETYTMDAGKIEALITERTSAIVPVHVYGNVCNIEEIEKIAHKYALKVVYDAAHAFGVRYNGRGIGAFGDASMFSFHATKVFHTIEGGAVCHSSLELGANLNRLRNFGISGLESVGLVGANAKMNEFQAAMGLCNLRHVEDEILKRKTVVEKYLECLGGVKGIRLPAPQRGVVSNYAYFPVVFDETVFGFDRDQVFDRLSEQNINARKYFFPLTSAFECYRGKYNPEDTPVAMDVARRILILPLYADIATADVERICDVIWRCTAGHGSVFHSIPGGKFYAQCNQTCQKE